MFYAISHSILQLFLHHPSRFIKHKVSNLLVILVLFFILGCIHVHPLNGAAPIQLVPQLELHAQMVPHASISVLGALLTSMTAKLKTIISLSVINFYSCFTRFRRSSRLSFQTSWLVLQVSEFVLVGFELTLFVLFAGRPA